VNHNSRDLTGRRGSATTDGERVPAHRRAVSPRLGSSPVPSTPESAVAEEFFRRALTEDLAPEDVFRITTTSFMDAYNFDVRQEMKACVHFVLPSGHLIPFSAYNLLYRHGHAPLPPLTRQFTAENAEVAERTEPLTTR